MDKSSAFCGPVDLSLASTACGWNRPRNAPSTSLDHPPTFLPVATFRAIFLATLYLRDIQHPILSLAPYYHQPQAFRFARIVPPRGRVPSTLWLTSTCTPLTPTCLRLLFLPPQGSSGVCGPLLLALRRSTSTLEVSGRC